MKKRKIIVLITCFILLVCLSSCSCQVGGKEFEGISVIWAPFYAIWNWLWNSFTPGFWSFVKEIWATLPKSIVWLAGIIVYIIGFVLYLIIFIIIIIIDIVIAVLAAIIWFILAVLNGIFHFN